MTLVLVLSFFLPKCFSNVLVTQHRHPMSGCIMSVMSVLPPNKSSKISHTSWFWYHIQCLENKVCFPSLKSNYPSWKLNFSIILYPISICSWYYACTDILFVSFHCCEVIPCVYYPANNFWIYWWGWRNLCHYVVLGSDFSYLKNRNLSYWFFWGLGLLSRRQPLCLVGPKSLAVGNGIPSWICSCCWGFNAVFLV